MSTVHMTKYTNSFRKYLSYGLQHTRPSSTRDPNQHRHIALHMETLPFGSRSATHALMQCQALHELHNSPGENFYSVQPQTLQLWLASCIPKLAAQGGPGVLMLCSVDLWISVSASQACWSNSVCTQAINSDTGSPFLTSEQVFPEHKPPTNQLQTKLRRWASVYFS